MGLNHKEVGPKEIQNRHSGPSTENQWTKTDYNFGNNFDMNYFTAPYNGLYRFHVIMRAGYGNHIFMNGYDRCIFALASDKLSQLLYDNRKLGRY